MSYQWNRRQFIGAGAAATAGVLLAGCGAAARSSGAGSTGKAVRGGTVVFPTPFDMQPPFDNPDLRKAIAYATNREAVVKAAFDGQARLATSPIGIGWAYDPKIKDPYPYNLTKARQHVKMAHAEGTTISFKNSSSTVEQAVAQTLQPGYSNIGFKLDYETVPAEEAFEDQKTGKITWTASDWTPRADPDGLLRILFYSTGFQNTMGYRNSKVDALLDQAAQLYDKSKAKPLYGQAVNLINEDANSVSICWINTVWAYRSNLQNVNVGASVAG